MPIEFELDFLFKLKAAQVWCSHLVDSTDPAGSVRNWALLQPLPEFDAARAEELNAIRSRVFRHGLNPSEYQHEFDEHARTTGFDGASAVELADVLDRVITNRVRIARDRGWKSADTRGRLLVYQPSRAPGKGLPEIVSRGFFDADICPGWDTWIEMIRPDPKKTGEEHASTLCWIPASLLPLVHAGIEADVSHRATWLGDRLHRSSPTLRNICSNVLNIDPEYCATTQPPEIQRPYGYYCPHCDYDITGIDSDVCPECGRVHRL